MMSDITTVIATLQRELAEAKAELGDLHEKYKAADEALEAKLKECDELKTQLAQAVVIGVDPAVVPGAEETTEYAPKAKKSAKGSK